MKALRFDLGPRAKAAALLTLVWVLGVLVGVGVDRALVGRALLARPAPEGVESPGPRPRWPRRDEMPMPQGLLRPGRMGELRFSQQMSEALGLTPEQKAAIDSIMEENRVRVRALAREYNPRFRAIVEETRRELDAVLTAEQRERLRAIQGSRRRMMRDTVMHREVSGAGRAGASGAGAGAAGAASSVGAPGTGAAAGATGAGTGVAAPGGTSL